MSTTPSGEIIPSGNALLLYDGLCGFCNNAVQWVIRHDRANRFHFAAQESSLAAGILARHGIDRAAMLRANSVYLLLHAGSPQESLLTESDVTVRILLMLGGRWIVLGRLLRAIPRSARNAAYRWFARNRYRISERYPACPIPSPAIRARFLA